MTQRTAQTGYGYHTSTSPSIKDYAKAVGFCSVFVACYILACML